MTQDHDLHDHLQASYDEEQNRYESAWANLASLQLPTYDGTGCRFIDLGPDVYGLVDYDEGAYRLGIYYSTRAGDDEGTVATFERFPDLQAFLFRLQRANAPQDPGRDAAREAFHAAVRAFYSAGMALVDAWDADGFNADEEYPLPPRIAPPLSLDEWLSELLRHYGSDVLGPV